MFQTQPKLRIRCEQQPGRTVLYLIGQLEAHSAHQFKKVFREMVGAAARCIDLNLAGLTRLDGVGLACLVWAWREAGGSEREVRVTQLSPSVRQLVERMNLHLLLRIVEERSPA